MLPFLEFFSGIGGFHAACHGLARVVAAWDQDAQANQTYLLNHGLRPSARNLQSVKAAELGPLGARGWFLSPPCQPYTQKGARRDIDDPRARPLLNLLESLPIARPDYLMLENVPPFAQSRARERLIQALEASGLHATEVLLCPTELGIPNRRRRYYLIASTVQPPRWERPAPPDLKTTGDSLAAYLGPDPDAELFAPEGFAETYGNGLDLVPESGGITACFGSSYGRARAHAGSYLASETRVRRFSPQEIVTLLCFPDTFRFPESASLLDRYRLAGNSVNVSCVRSLLSALVHTQSA